MNTRRFIILALAVTAGALAFSACGKSDAAGDADKEENGAQIVSVRVESIEPKDFSEEVRVTGSIAAYEDVTVPAEEGGRLVEWKVPRGARVAKGQVIAKLDDALLKAGFDAANAQYQMAELNATKQEKVYKEQGISELQIRSFEYQRDAAKAGADLAKARLEKTNIKSPVNGVLEYQFVDEGEMVGPGMPVARVVNNSRLKILAGVPERYAGAFKVGDAVTFTVDAFPGQKFSARVAFVGAAVTRDNRTIPVEAVISNGANLKPDMIAAMRILLDARKDAIVIREDYLQQVEKNRFIVFVDDNGVARERRVETGGSTNGFVHIINGLSRGERLITLGFQNVADGQKIVVQN